MRPLFFALVFATSLAATAHSEDRPLVEKYLHSGQLLAGEQQLEAALRKEPDNDQLRFGLGVLQVMRGIERLGQSLYEYGAKADAERYFISLPLPVNPDPAPITNLRFRRVLDDFARDLATAETTLAKIDDEDVQLPLRLAEIRLDLNGDGKAEERLLDIIKGMTRNNFAFLEKNPEFLVKFDRGDVAWLRAYCHLLMGLIECSLAFDSDEAFELSAHEWAARPTPRFEGSDQERQKRLQKLAEKPIAVKEPHRLDRFRRHWLEVVELNRETWKHIRAEEDNDYEWLPNQRQGSVFGATVDDATVDRWLRMLTEVETILAGKQTLGFFEKDGKSLNVKTFLEDPPAELSADLEAYNNLPDKYYSAERSANLILILRALSQFSASNNMPYAAWLN